ncbi:hypothetical protein M427DRAFT_115459 [Gonapodya prolifera JEL478]|uniref:Zinc finger HIT domain-containing protein 3 n=1 Tax=Gonapodya prolifera (strain JEL478) TaxID=1344416 RepID=A0A139A274_GONPJ|nr:hypothetical protein M427DRAFT_115459 [Gonapodya prolifera JEL478]|eukprot:KXS10877.1 hypothetical protein M427DRAFT_115459 [Gonapodya prolifera JEL478]
MTSKPPVVCGVCNLEPPKYKCPTCLINYCSLACFKNHKAIGCTKPEPVVPPHSADEPKAGIALEDEDDAALTDEQLRALGTDPAIRALLSSPDLRQVLNDIDSSKDPEARLERARANVPEFVQFVETCLDTVGKMKRDPTKTS